MPPHRGTRVRALGLRRMGVLERSRLQQRDKTDPRQMSQAELNDYLDRLVTQGLDDTPEFHQAYKIWKRNQ